MRSTRSVLFGLAATWLSLALPASAQQPETATYSKTADIPYAVVGGRTLALDIYRPNGVARPPLLVWIHGGRWLHGTKETINTLALVEEGFAIASVDFRQTGDAPFPAQIHDIKAAIRFLRANAETYGFDPERIGIHGRSSGGHLTALVGVTNGVEALEGDVGSHLDVSSDVQVVVSYFGASNLTTIMDQSTRFGASVRGPALERLFGGPLGSTMAIAKLASPVFHVDASDPPLLLLHGDQDPQMPINQAHELHGIYEAHGLPVQFEVVHGAKHGTPEFFDAKRTALVAAFLKEHLGVAR